MAETVYKEIKTRIALKTLPLLGENSWDSIKDTYIPLKGEVCICEIPQGNANATTAPTILFKVGDGTSTWGQLKWASALAADVYDWAKKPQAEFITWVNTVVEHPAAPVITTGNENGTIAVDGADVAVKGLGSAAYTNADAYATSAENGAKQAAADAQKTIDDYAVAHKDDYTNKQIDDAIAAVDTGVYAVDLATGDANGQVKLTVDGESKNVDVKGLASAAYVTVESLNTTAKGYADAVETGVENGTIIAAKATNADNAAEATHATNADNATNAVHAGSAGKVDNALTVKVGGADVVFDGSAPKTADVDAAIATALTEAKEYADDNDANTEYHVEYDSTSKKIKLVAGADADKMEIDATAFIKDGMIESVELVQEDGEGKKGQFLKLTWNDDGKDVTYVSVGELVDVYTATENATEVQVVISNENKVSATLVNGGVSTAKIADDAVTADKLANGINIDIAKGVTAHDWGDHSQAGYAKTADLGDLATKDDITHDLVTDFDTAVAAVKVSEAEHADAATNAENASHAVAADEATHADGADFATNAGHAGSADEATHAASADNATKAADADKLGGQLPSYYATAEALNTVSGVANDAKTHASTNAGLIQGNTDRIKALEDANHISEVTTTENGGLKVTNKNQIDIDDEVVFVLNCNW